MARTLIAERLPCINPEVIEAQLAHGKSGPLGMAYDRAEFMEPRRQMMPTPCRRCLPSQQGIEMRLIAIGAACAMNRPGCQAAHERILSWVSSAGV